MWIVDFGSDMSLADAAHLRGAVSSTCRRMSSRSAQKNNRATYRDRWWLHVEARSGMRKALTGLSRFLVTPTVASIACSAWSAGRASYRITSSSPSPATTTTSSASSTRAPTKSGRSVWTPGSVRHDPRCTHHHLLRDLPPPVAPGSGAGRLAEQMAIARRRGSLNELRESWLTRRAWRRRT